jgi:glycosyltransferase involved in cell wall biosynthesis
MEAFRRLGPVPRLTGLAFGAGTDDVERHGLPPIRYSGPLRSAEELAAVYCAADIFVIPSLAEAFGQTAMEAMACGRPVVGFDTGGIPDIVRPGQTGLLAAPGDTAQLADAIAWMMQHRAEREAMGRNARAMVEAQFTLERQARQYVELYRLLLGNRA